MAERLKAPVLKTGVRKHRGFESHTLRQIKKEGRKALFAPVFKKRRPVPASCRREPVFPATEAVKSKGAPAKAQLLWGTKPACASTVGSNPTLSAR